MSSIKSTSGRESVPQKVNLVMQRKQLDELLKGYSNTTGESETSKSRLRVEVRGDTESPKLLIRNTPVSSIREDAPSTGVASPRADAGSVSIDLTNISETDMSQKIQRIHSSSSSRPSHNLPSASRSQVTEKLASNRADGSNASPSRSTRSGGSSHNQSLPTHRTRSSPSPRSRRSASLAKHSSRDPTDKYADDLTRKVEETLERARAFKKQHLIVSEIEPESHESSNWKIMKDGSARKSKQRSYHSRGGLYESRKIGKSHSSKDHTVGDSLHPSEISVPKSKKNSERHSHRQRQNRHNDATATAPGKKSSDRVGPSSRATGKGEKGNDGNRSNSGETISNMDNIEERVDMLAIKAEQYLQKKKVSSNRINHGGHNTNHDDLLGKRSDRCPQLLQTDSNAQVSQGEKLHKNPSDRRSNQRGEGKKLHKDTSDRKSKHDRDYEEEMKNDLSGIETKGSITMQQGQDLSQHPKICSPPDFFEGANNVKDSVQGRAVEVFDDLTEQVDDLVSFFFLDSQKPAGVGIQKESRRSSKSRKKDPLPEKNWSPQSAKESVITTTNHEDAGGGEAIGKQVEERRDERKTFLESVGGEAIGKEVFEKGVAGKKFLESVWPKHFLGIPDEDGNATKSQHAKSEKDLREELAAARAGRVRAADPPVVRESRKSTAPDPEPSEIDVLDHVTTIEVMRSQTAHLCAPFQNVMDIVEHLKMINEGCPAGRLINNGCPAANIPGLRGAVDAIPNTFTDVEKECYEDCAKRAATNLMALEQDVMGSPTMETNSSFTKSSKSKRLPMNVRTFRRSNSRREDPPDI